MEALTNRLKSVDRHKMTLWERIYLPAVFKGLMITLRHFLQTMRRLNYEVDGRHRPVREIARDFLRSSGLE